jgi:SM-20-related protein
VNFDDLNTSLENKHWFFQKKFISDKHCKSISKRYFNQSEEGSFIRAKIGSGTQKRGNIAIRNSSVKWIDTWEKDPSLHYLNQVFTNIMSSTNKYFSLSLKRFESQLALYNRGGFYKKHLDQHRNNRHRQISCCLYLNDCKRGGELIIYKKGSKTEIDKIIKPEKGSIVVFFSASIYHEVKVVKESRHSISTWFRDDELLPFIS